MMRRRRCACGLTPAAPAANRLTLDERVVALDPAVRGEDEEVESDSERLPVLVDPLPVELDDVAESLGAVAPRKLSPSEPTQCSYALAARASISSYPRASRVAFMASPGRAAIARISCGGWRICLPSFVQSSAIIRRRRSASGSFQSARYFSANSAALRDEISTKACVSVIGFLR
jgi:hypothetical protein